MLHYASTLPPLYTAMTKEVLLSLVFFRLAFECSRDGGDAVIEIVYDKNKNKSAYNGNPRELQDIQAGTTIQMKFIKK